MKRLGVALSFLVVGCTVGPTVPRGQVTVQGRGSEALTNQGDPLMTTGTDERKVPIDFAKGYAKGISDQVKRNYWQIELSAKNKILIISNLRIILRTQQILLGHFLDDLKRRKYAQVLLQPKIPDSAH
jgi:hypothetical protein